MATDFRIQEMIVKWLKGATTGVKVININNVYGNIIKYVVYPFHCRVDIPQLYHSVSKRMEKSALSQTL